MTVVRAFGEWAHKSRNQVIAARSTFNFGVDAFDATHHSDGQPDSQFFSWLGQFQWARRIVGGTQVLFRVDAQLSNDDLLPLEKFAVGGPDTVRGYRENQFVRDNGWVTSLELRIPIYNNPDRGGMIQIAPFIDAGRSWNEDLPDIERKFIAGTGLGLLWDPTPKVHGQVYWGYALKNVDERDTGLQDKGIYFQLSYRG